MKSKQQGLDRRSFMGRGTGEVKREVAEAAGNRGDGKSGNAGMGGNAVVPTR
jgi:hypothetical protein